MGKRRGRPRKDQTTPEAATTTVDGEIPMVEPESMTEGGPLGVPNIPCVPPIPDDIPFIAPEVEFVTLRIPIGVPPVGGYIAQHIDAGGLSREAGAGIRAATVGLESQTQRLNKGRHVHSAVDVVKWLGEEIFRQMQR